MLLPKAEGEGRRVALLGGESGSGKSRLVRELAADAAAEGALVLYGACDAVVRSPYGPFAQALERLANALEPDELRAALGAGAGELTRLLPDLRDRIGDVPPPTRGDPDTESHRLHAAVTDLLDRVSRRQPVLLVIEDGHWADAPTLVLLRHLARAAWTGRVLLFATFRDTEADVPESLALTLADLRRSDDIVRLRLEGLSDNEVGEFVSRVALGHGGAELSEVAQTISELTAGNAFLVCELWRAMVDTGTIEVTGGTVRLTRPLERFGTPESVREVVGERLTRLAPTTTELLELAATAGSEFTLDVVGRSSGLHDDELLAAIDEAIRSGMVAELPGRTLAYRFTHELVRRAVYDRLTRVRQAELHLRVGEALEAAGAPSSRTLPDLAYHFAAAAPLGEVRRAVAYSILAARAAAEALAFDDASELLSTALDLGIDDPAQRAVALIELGMTKHRAGKSQEALDAFSSASDIARSLGDAELLAQAATGFEEACWRPGVSRDARGLLEEAAAALGDQESQLRVGVLSGLARAYDHHGQQERASVVRASAIDLARRLDDRAGLTTVLVRSYWSRGVTPIDEILEMLTEAKALGEELGNTELQAEAMAWRAPTFVAIADIPSARAEVAALRATAQETQQPFMLHVAEHYGAAIALADGRLDAAQAMADRSEEAGRLLTGRDASGTYGIQMFSLRREQGRLAELAAVARILAAGERPGGAWPPGFASLLVELGMEAEARQELTHIVGNGLDDFRESLWVASLTYITDACAAVGDEAAAALVYPALAPLSGTNLMIGNLVATYGSADRYLGMLAATLGEWELAEHHFELALGLNRRMAARTWLAHSAYEYGRMLLARGTGERQRASLLLAEADQLARQIGMPTLQTRIHALGATAPAAALPDDLSAREAEILRLIARGLSNREIGAQLFISEHTAANHVRSILRKTGCANRTEAASYAHRRALVDA